MCVIHSTNTFFYKNKTNKESNVITHTYTSTIWYFRIFCPAFQFHLHRKKIEMNKSPNSEGSVSLRKKYQIWKTKNRPNLNPP
jgi:hypothetical protein